MILEVCKRDKIAMFWLSNQEKEDKEFRQSLKPQYREWKSKGYKVACFLSGKGDIVESTKELLIHNKEVLAEQKVMRELYGET